MSHLVPWSSLALVLYLAGSTSVVAETDASADDLNVFTLEDATDAVLSVAISGDSKLLASGSRDKKVRVYDIGDSSAPRLKYTSDDATREVYSVAFSGDSKLLASTDGKVRVYDVGDSSAPRLKYTFDDVADSVAFSGDSKLLASGDYGGTDKARVYDIGNVSAPILKYTFDRGGWVAFSGDSKLLAVGWGLTVELYDIENVSAPSLKYTLHQDCWGTFSGDSKLLATNRFDWAGNYLVGVYDIGNVSAPSVKYTLGQGFRRIFTSLAFSGDSKLLASSSVSSGWGPEPSVGGFQVVVYDIGDSSMPSPKYTLNPTDEVYSVAFSGDSKLLVSGSSDTRVRGYDVGGFRRTPASATFGEEMIV